jgi:hypothetical protein
MIYNSVNQGGGPAANTLNYPYNALISNHRLLIADYYNHRVLIFNNLPNYNDASADIVLGQPDMTSNTLNQGGLPAANTLNYPRGVDEKGTKFFIADTENHRILIFNTLPLTNNSGADVVVGQPNMLTNTANSGGLDANRLDFPYSCCSDGTRLYIADFGNHRVLIFDTIPAVNNASADVVVGQPDMTSNLANNGGIGANTLNHPVAVHTDGTRLFIADRDNNRVLVFNNIPAVNNTSADVVAGQPDMTSNLANNGGISANTLYSPRSVYSDGTSLYIADRYNHRIVVFNTIPLVNNTSADSVIGQPDMTSRLANNGGIGANTLDSPRHASCQGTVLAVSDRANNRVLLYGQATATPTTPPTPIFSPAITPAIPPLFQVKPGLVRISRGESAKFLINLTQSNHVRLKIYNLNGKFFISLIDSYLTSGTHEFLWDGNNAGSGTYLARLECEGRQILKKVVLVR